MTGFSLTENIFIIGSLSPHVRESGIWEIFLRNPSSTDKESRMQYPWHRIENPRLSDFLAWADLRFQLDKIKDIMCFHYLIFPTRKKSHKFHTIICKFFICEKSKQFIFPMSLFLAVFYCRWNEEIIINYHCCDTKNWIHEMSGLKISQDSDTMFGFNF